jgi:hypothetical protein
LNATSLPRAQTIIKSKRKQAAYDERPAFKRLVKRPIPESPKPNRKKDVPVSGTLAFGFSRPVICMSKAVNPP